MDALGTLDPFHRVAHGVADVDPGAAGLTARTVAYPCRPLPRQAVDQRVLAPCLGFLGHPPLVATLEVRWLGADVHVARLRPVGRQSIAPDLQLEDVQSGTEGRLEKVVQDLVALLGWIGR